MTTIQPIIIFDGDCSFCNRSVVFVLNNDKTETIHVCSGNGSTAKKLIQEYHISDDLKKTIVYVNDNQVYYRSSAVLHICKKMKGLYPLAFLFIVVPPFIRDTVYDFIAKHRKKIIKKEYTCANAPSKFRNRILD